MRITNKTIILILLPAICLLSSEIFAQNKDPEKVRRVRYIGSVKSDSPAKSPSPRKARRTISLEPSEIAESDEGKFLERDIFHLINLNRLEQGLPALEWAPELADLAREHSRNMAVHGFFSHFGLNGTTVDLRATDFGIEDWRGIGENIAYNKGIDDPTNFTVRSWMMSPGHRRNILNRQWSESGIGIAVTKDGKYFYTQIFMIR